MNDANTLIRFIDQPDLRNEDFGCIASEVHREISGVELPYDDHPSLEVSREAPARDVENEWDLEEEIQNRKHLPRFCEVYYSKEGSRSG